MVKELGNDYDIRMRLSQEELAMACCPPYEMPPEQPESTFEIQGGVETSRDDTVSE